MIVIIVISILASMGLMAIAIVILCKHFRRRRVSRVGIIELTKDDRIKKFVMSHPNKANYSLYSMESNLSFSEKECCSICLDELKGQVYKISCGHIFHRYCL